MNLDLPLDIAYQKALSEIADIVSTVDGVYSVNDRPLEQVNVFPAAWVFPLAGSYYLQNNGEAYSEHTVLIEIMTERNDLPRDVDLSLPFGNQVALALLAHPYLNGAVSHIGIEGNAPIRASYDYLEYAGTMVLGWTIELDFVQMHNVTMTSAEERQFNLDYSYAYADLYTEVAHLCQTVNGIENTFDRPPEQAGDSPFGIITPANSIYHYESAGTVRGLHSFDIQIHQARNELPRDSDKVLPLASRVAQKILENQTLNDSADTFGLLTYFYGFLGYGDTSTIGWRMNLSDIKLRMAI